ncbi:hypothetical protein [Pantanalinema sp. GBBB05]|uniref:hypothetical protein n=1 Tax=Pantanalinema sp. GBBB05 TaxID=2604139 RepID=UPI003D816DBA
MGLHLLTNSLGWKGTTHPKEMWQSRLPTCPIAQVTACLESPSTVPDEKDVSVVVPGWASGSNA